MYIQHWCRSAVAQCWAVRWWGAASGDCDQLRAPRVSWPGNLLNYSSPSRCPPTRHHSWRRAVASGLQIRRHMTMWFECGFLHTIHCVSYHLIRLHSLLHAIKVSCVKSVCFYTILSFRWITCSRSHKDKCLWLWWFQTKGVFLLLIYSVLHEINQREITLFFEIKVTLQQSVYLSCILCRLLCRWAGSVDSPGTRAGRGAAGTLGCMWWTAGWASALPCPGALCETTQRSKSGHSNLSNTHSEEGFTFTWGRSLVRSRAHRWWKQRFPFPWHHGA